MAKQVQYTDKIRVVNYRATIILKSGRLRVDGLVKS